VKTPFKYVSSVDLCVIGGRTDYAAQAEALLAMLPQDMPFSICAYLNRCSFTQGPLPDLLGMQRLRCFGPAGDLDLRLDGGQYHWRFVGASGDWAKALDKTDFWGHTGIKRLTEQESSVVLWGKYGGGSYREARVASVNMSYPLKYTPKEGSFAAIKLRTYAHMGRPQFSWYIGLGEVSANA